MCSVHFISKSEEAIPHDRKKRNNTKNDKQVANKECPVSLSMNKCFEKMFGSIFEKKKNYLDNNQPEFLCDLCIHYVHLMSHPHSVQTGFSSLLPISFLFHPPFLGSPLPLKYIPLATSLRYSRTAVLNLDM